MYVLNSLIRSVNCFFFVTKDRNFQIGITFFPWIITELELSQSDFDTQITVK